MKVEKSDLQLETIVSRIRAGDLDLQPDFQRGEIWDKRRRQRLIDTILRGWYVPAIHIVINPEGAEEVLDGQQRLAAIRDFFEDGVKIDGNIDPRDEKIVELNGLSYSELPTLTKRAVNRFALSVVTLSDYGPQEPNELFFRLNQSYNLTPPEKRNALHGPSRDQVKQLVNELTKSGLLDRAKIGFSNGRLAYDDIIARTCTVVEQNTMRKHVNNDSVEQFYRGSKSFADATFAGVEESGVRLLEQINASTDRVKFNKGTLQSWMLYCFWAPSATGGLPDDLLTRFEEDRGHVKRGESLESRDGGGLLSEILRLYDDRASYRVTDVSSVLMRDLAIHLYSQVEFGTLPAKDSDELLNRLRENPTAFQTLVVEYLEESQWGSPLLDGGIVDEEG